MSISNYNYVSMSSSYFGVRRSLRLFLVALVPVLLQLVTIEFQVLEALPFPAPDLQRCKDVQEGCCNSFPNVGPSTKFKFQPHLPMRVRRAAHLVDDAYIAKYQHAMELMRALPATDGRSFVNQYKLHCVYCDNHLYFKEHVYPLEIHQNWLFFPWHRMYIYFHERILANLLGDDTFALPFWNWDNQSGDQSPQANVVPKVYAEKWSFNHNSINKTSSLYSPDRNNCTRPPNIVDFQRPLNCSRNTLQAVRDANSNVMYSHLVSSGVTPLTFFGRPYRFGDQGALGKGCIEGVPHGTVHQWVNIKDMATFKDSASDPIFFAHHAQIDRLWSLWKTFPGDWRNDLRDEDWLDTEFTFYDEHGKSVSASISQFLDMDLLRYKYEEVPIPWLDGAFSKEFCNPKSSKSDIAAMIKRTKRLEKPEYFIPGPITFKVKRPRRTSSSSSRGEEILELKGQIDWTIRLRGLCAWAFFPDVNSNTTSWGCAELLECVSTTPHTGMSMKVPHEFVWRMGIRRKLELVGRGDVDEVVITLSSAPVNQTGEAIGFLLTHAAIVYSKL